MSEDEGWSAVPEVLERRMRERGITKSQIVRKHGVDWGTVAKLQNGESVREDACWRVASALGWRPDAFDRIRRGETPLDADDSPTASSSDTGDDLEHLLGAGGRLVRAELDEIKRRLDRLENTDGATVTPLDPKQRSRKADPGYRVEIDQAAGGDIDQADTDHEDVGPHQRGPDVHPDGDFNQDPGGE